MADVPARYIYEYRAPKRFQGTGLERAPGTGIGPTKTTLPGPRFGNIQPPNFIEGEFSRVDTRPTVYRGSTGSTTAAGSASPAAGVLTGPRPSARPAPPLHARPTPPPHARPAPQPAPQPRATSGIGSLTPQQVQDLQAGVQQQRAAASQAAGESNIARRFGNFNEGEAGRAASDSGPPSPRSQGARLLGGRELFSGPWFNRSRASFKSSSNRADSARNAASSRASR